MPVPSIARPARSLVDQIARHTPQQGSARTAIPALELYRHTSPQPPAALVYRPSLCVIAQGRKRILLADESFIYDADHFLLIAADLPVTGEVFEATPKKPFLGLRLALDAALVADTIAEAPEPARGSPSRALAVSRADDGLLDAVGRLVGLLDTPHHLGVLAPLVQREIVYRLLLSPQGARLRQIATGDSHGQRITRALRWLQSHFAEPLRVDALAKEVRMSPSALHHHFKSVTAMSPLQYQKSLRLREARRLMLGEGLDAAEASFRVGYESPSQFSREYRRLFGAPPKRDVSALRDVPASAS